MDVRLPPGFRDEGLRAALAIRQRDPKSPVQILSQYVERTYAAELIADGNGAVGYLLKDRVTALDEFLDAIERVATGGTVMDPEVIRQLFARNNRDHGVTALTAREREVLAPPSVEKHITSVLSKLGLPPSDDTHRRVRAVLAYLNH